MIGSQNANCKDAYTVGFPDFCMRGKSKPAPFKIRRVRHPVGAERLGGSFGCPPCRRITLWYSIAIVRLFLINVAALIISVGALSANQGHQKPGIAGTSGAPANQYSEKPQQNQESAESKAIRSLAEEMKIQEQRELEDFRARESHAGRDSDIQRKLVKYTRLLALVGALQFIVLALTCLVIYKQVILMGEHATHFKNLAGFTDKNAIAAKANADAALATAKAVEDSVETAIKSERAWFLMDKIEGQYLEPVEIQYGRKSTAFFDLKNFGKTMGKMTAWKFGLYITNVDQVPSFSAYDLSGLVFNPAMIPEGAPIPHFAELQTDSGIVTRQDLDGIIKHGTRFLWLCGIVRYEDVLKANSEHETMFCYRYREWIPGRIPFFGLAGPDKYNKVT